MPTGKTNSFPRGNSIGIHGRLGDFQNDLLTILTRFSFISMAHIDQLLPMDTRRQAKHTNTIGPDHRRTISPWFMTLAKRPSWRIFKPQCQTNRLPMFSSTINFQIPNMKCTPDGQRFNLAPGTLMCSYMFLIVQKKATNRIHFMYIPPTTRGRRILSE